MVFIDQNQFNVVEHQTTPVELQVIGTLPTAIAGTLFRTVPAYHSIDGTPKGKFSVSHWFDGWSTVYRFQLEPTEAGNCKVLFNSRRQVDPLIEVARKTGNLNGFGFGQKRDPCESFFSKLKTVFLPVSPVDMLSQNLHVTIHPGTLNYDANENQGMLSRTDNTFCKMLDKETLEPIGATTQVKLHPELSGPISCAHAQYDPATGDCYNYNLSFGRTPVYKIFRVSSTTGETEILGSVKGFGVLPAYVHSFFLTENFAILCVWPSYFSAGGLKTLWTRNLLDAMYFDSEAMSKWYVVDRRHGNGLVATFTSHPMFSFHTVNAYETPSTTTPGNVDIVCDLIEYKNTDVLHRLYYDNLTSQGTGTASFHKAVGDNAHPSYGCYKLSSIPLDGPTLDLGIKPPTTPWPVAERISRLSSPFIGELPAINPDYSTHHHRYIYGLCDRGLSSWVDGLVKTDVDTKRATYWTQPKHTPGEPIFIPDPARKGQEDGGFVLSVVLDGERGTSFLLCLDAETMKEVGRAEAGRPVGLGFHGCHVPIAVA